MSTEWLSVLSVFLAAAATIFGGGLVLAKKSWDAEMLRYSIAFGAGFMLAAATLAMLPESFRLTEKAPIFFLLGYLTLHFFEHTIAPHFHFGEETHSDAVVSPIVGFTSMLGLSIHNVFDGISIGAGYLVSPVLGLLIFGAVVLHKLPDGFTIASIVIAGGHSHRKAFYASVVLALSTVLGAFLIHIFNDLVPYALPFSAGVTFYIAATDLVPIINETRGLRYSTTFFAGILIFYLSDLLLQRVLQ